MSCFMILIGAFYAKCPEHNDPGCCLLTQDVVSVDGSAIIKVSMIYNATSDTVCFLEQ